jgi:hypothetical protein
METNWPTSLVAAGNTYNPSLIVLRDKGYELWLEVAKNRMLWCAKKGAHRFMAYSGPERLGLVVLWEHLGENWNQQKPDILGELTDRIDDEPGNEKLA